MTRLTMGALVAALLLLAAETGGGATEGELVVASNYTTHLWGEIFTVRADGGGRRNLTRSPFDDRSPVRQPGGRTIAFLSNRSGYTAIWTMGLDGSSMRRLTGRLPGGYIPNSAPAWDPSGRWLLVDGYRNGAASFAVFFVALDGGHARRLSSGSFGAWAPDGRIAVFFTNRKGENFADVLSRNGKRLWRRPGVPKGWSVEGHLAVGLLDRGASPGRTVIYDRSGGVLTRFPGWALAWSPRGTGLSYTVRDRKASHLWVGDLRGPRRRFATTDNANGFAEVRWAPDGSSLGYYTYTRAGTVLARAVNVTTGRTTRLPGFGRWSPDGRMFAFEGPDVRSIHVAVTGARTGRLVARDPAPIRGVDWLPDGRRLLFEASRGGENDADLYLARRTGGLVRRLTSGGTWESMPAWSPDGRTLAFSAGYPHCHASHCSRYYDNDIWVLHEGSSPRRLTRTEGEGYFDDASPAWSPDGREIAFVRTPRDQEFQELPGELRVVPVAGGVARVLAAPARAPTWSPDGKSIAFFQPGGRIYVTAPDGTGLRALGPARVGRGSSISWAPDGSRLAFIGAAGDLYTVGVTDGSVTRLGPAGLGARSDVAWSPDGSRVAFAGTGVGVVSVSTGRVTWLDRRAGATRPLWSPNSRLVAFSLPGDVFVVPAAGGGAAEVIPGPSEESDPAWRK